MGLITYLILLAITGLIVGALARLILPGRDPMSILETMAVGILGSFAAGLVAMAIFDGRRSGSFLLSLVFATLFVWLYRKMRTRGNHRDTHGHTPGRHGFGH